MVEQMDPAGFSDQALAGHRLLVGFDGDDFNDDLRHVIGALRVAGIILFSRNLGGPDDIRQMCASAQTYATECGLPPLIIAIDQEGGTVARLKEPFTLFPGNAHIHEENQADRFAAVTAVELAHIGVNMDLAPVLDVAGSCSRSIMKERAFPGPPEAVARLGMRVIDGLQSRKIMAVAKHFPGIGRTMLDSHVDQPELDANPEILAETDLLPFKTAIEHQVAGIMLSHIKYTHLDPDFPASLSTPIACDLLRKQLGYTGVVMTDDLEMGAVTRHYDMDTMVDCLIRADVDLALICSRSPARDQAWETIVRSISSSSPARDRARASVKRVMDLKQHYLMPPS